MSINLSRFDSVAHCKKMCFNLSSILLLWSVILLVNLCCVSGKDLSCSALKLSRDVSPYSNLHIPDAPLTGTQFKICSQGLTCCTKEMEEQFSISAKQQYDKLLKDSLSSLSSLFKTRMTRLDEFFKELLTNSKKDFHSMFKKTYGTIYEQNSFVFTDLYRELEEYYSKGRVNLLEAMENFFNVLGVKMFSVMHAQYHYDDKYLSCLSEHVTNFKPFGDVPVKLSVKLKRSFIALRTLSQSLGVGSDVASNMISLVSTNECYKVVTKMQKCSLCQGYIDLKPCNNYCINVMKGCLTHHAALDSSWNSYIDANDKIISRLLDSFNIKSVVSDINVIISEAIMNFQENNTDVSQKVFTKCGKPQLGRRRRNTPAKLPSSSSQEAAPEPSNFDDNQGHNPNSGRKRANGNRRRLQNNKNNEPHVAFQDTYLTSAESENKEANLDDVMRDIQSKIKSTRNFWSQLAYNMCSDENVSASPKAENNCWNGTEKARYNKEAVTGGLSNLLENSEVMVNGDQPNILLHEQLNTLNSIHNKLKNAFNGHDVDWVDAEETFNSGSGSGFDPNLSNKGGPDDDEDGPDYPSSGQKPTSEVPQEKGNEPDDIKPPQISTSSPNEEDNDLKPIFHLSKDKYSEPSAGKATLGEKLTLNRALASYLLPVVVVWIGNSFTEWVQLL